MLTGTCHCGAVRIEIPAAPETLTNCNCSTCRRYGALWAYFDESEVTVSSAPDATESYSWGEKNLRFVRCAQCGCVTHWERIGPRKSNRMGVNARNFDPLMFGDVKIRRLDGADTWEVLPD
jgi:hypothetical protein